MNKSTTVLTKKRRGPKPTGKGTLVGVRLQPELLQKVDALRSKSTPAVSRPEMVRKIIAERLSDTT